MKNKWLIILFIFFLVVILLSLLITQQSQKAVSLLEKEIPTEQAESKIPLTYSSQAWQAPITTLPLVKSGITIIKAPAIEREEKNNSVSKITDKAANNVSSQNVASSTEVQDLPQTGITKIGKRPTTKEIQEMNSSGIVMY